nr:immunoglobulin heavy chain junction region [Mus musculus]
CARALGPSYYAMDYW